MRPRPALGTRCGCPPQHPLGPSGIYCGQLRPGGRTPGHRGPEAAPRAVTQPMVLHPRLWPYPQPGTTREEDLPGRTGEEGSEASTPVRSPRTERSLEGPGHLIGLPGKQDRAQMQGPPGRWFLKTPLENQAVGARPRTRARPELRKGRQNCPEASPARRPPQLHGPVPERTSRG